MGARATGEMQTGEGTGDDPLAEMGLQGGKNGDENDPAADGNVPETRMVTDMFASLENNDLASLKLFLDENGGDINSYVNSIEYSYNVVPQIFDGNTEDGVRRSIRTRRSPPSVWAPVRPTRSCRPCTPPMCSAR